MSIFSGQPSSLLRVDVERIMDGNKQRTGGRGAWYRAKIGDELLVAGTVEPFYSLARALKAKGYTGKYGMWVDDKLRLAGDIEKNIKFSVVEGSRGIELRRFVESDNLETENDDD